MGRDQILSTASGWEEDSRLRVRTLMANNMTAALETLAGHSMMTASAPEPQNRHTDRAVLFAKLLFVMA